MYHHLSDRDSVMDAAKLALDIGRELLTCADAQTHPKARRDALGTATRAATDLRDALRQLHSSADCDVMVSEILDACTSPGADVSAAGDEAAGKG